MFTITASSIQAIDTQTKESISSLEDELNTSIATLDSKTIAYIAELEQEFNTSIVTLDTKVGDSYKVITSRLDKLEEFDKDITKKLEDINSSIIPETVGQIAWFYSECPKDWYKLDGREIVDDKLITILDSATLPDLRNQFIRMIGEDRAIGDKQEDATAVNGLEVQIHSVTPNGRSNLYIVRAEGSNYAILSSHDIASVRLFGDTETRPMNIGLNLCIKGTDMD